MCFGRPFERYAIPELPRGDSNPHRSAFCLAPYYIDLDPTVQGDIYYQVYDNTGGAADATVVANAMQLVIDSYGAVDFVPDYIVVATWVDLPQYDDTSGEVRNSGIIMHFKYRFT